MAIKRNAVSSDYITDGGDYVVKIIETKAGLSKKDKPMLTVKFQTKDGKSISAYFVKELQFHMAQLIELKKICGLMPTDMADNLIGKEVGIAVEKGKPTEEGRTFMQIVGYGPKEEVKTGTSNSFSDVEVPF